MSSTEPRIVVFTTLFPHQGQPGAGLFVRERMFRVAAMAPLTVVVPIPWFPFQGLIRRWRSSFRPVAPGFEVQNGIEVRFPRFLSVPGAFKWLDGCSMALCCLPMMRRLRRSFRFDIIDAHFAYPEGYAAALLGRWLRVATTITLRGTEVPLSSDARRRRRILKALEQATLVFSVSESLKQHVTHLGANPDKITVVGNGVDTERFRAIPQATARRQLRLPTDGHVLISVGALVERKGFHRVIECLPKLLSEFPTLRYLVVGGGGPEGDWGDLLQQRAVELGVQDHVIFTGPIAPDRLPLLLSAANVFVLATRNEGWANVFLEAMACGLPVITTNVGGNMEVVNGADLGTIVPFGDEAALVGALVEALRKSWDRDVLVRYAQRHSWDTRVATLLRNFRAIASAPSANRHIPLLGNAKQ